MSTEEYKVFDLRPPPPPKKKVIKSTQLQTFDHHPSQPSLAFHSRREQAAYIQRIHIGRILVGCVLLFVGGVLGFFLFSTPSVYEGTLAFISASSSKRYSSSALLDVPEGVVATIGSCIGALLVYLMVKEPMCRTLKLSYPTHSSLTPKPRSQSPRDANEVRSRRF